MASEEMSREEKEALLNIRMEQIRKKNAELQKRYEEVKADKQNAEEISDTFQEKYRNIVEEPRARRAPPKPSDRPREKTRYNEGKTPQRLAPEEQEKRRPQRFTEDDAPPPDPSYSFLADRSREGNSSSVQDRRRDSRRHLGNYGGKDFENVKSTIEHRRNYDKSSPRQPPQSKMEMSMRMTGRERCEYERWRSERSKIEHDRMNRQKTSSGEWKREWDREKQPSDEPEEAVLPNQWGPRNRVGGRGGRAGWRGRGSRPWSDHPQQQSYPESSDAPPPQENQPRSRHIHVDNENINISFSNDRMAPANQTWRTSNDRRSTSSREYSSSVSEDERPQPARRSNMRWRDQGRSPKSQKLPIEEDAVFQNEEQPPTGVKPVDPQPQSPEAGQGAIEQRVTFVDASILSPLGAQPQPPSSQVDGPQIGDDVRDDASWDDEGSWEETTSGNESQDLSQRSQEVSEAKLPANDVAETVPEVPGVEFAAVPPESTATLGVDAAGAGVSPQPDSHESTPVAEFQDATSDGSEQPDVCSTMSAECGEIVHVEAATEVCLQAAESQHTAALPPKTLEFSQQPAEIAQQPIEPSTQQMEASHQPVKCQKIAEASQPCTESFQQLAELGQHTVESPDKVPETQASEEKSKTCVSPDASSFVPQQDVPQAEISPEKEDLKQPVAGTDMVHGADSAATGEDEAQAAPVPSEIEARHAEKSEQ